MNVQSTLLVILFLSTLCAATSNGQGSGVGEDHLFPTDPTQAVSEATGLEADGVTAAEPRADGGASIESANSLTTATGRRFENVQGAQVDADGNVVRADHIELDGSSLEDVEDLTPTATGGFSVTRAEQLNHPAASATDGVDIAADGDRISVDSASSVTAGGITAFDAEGFVSDNGIVSVKRASRIEISDGILGTVEEFAGDAIGFDIGSARDIVVGCVSLRGVEQSHVAIKPDGVVVAPYSQDVDFTISDCGFEQSSYQAFSEESSISIPRSVSGSYQIHDGELTCHGLQASDQLETSGEATVEYGAECFSCLQFEGAGSYWHNSEEIVRDFGLTLPDDISGYRLCIRKQSDGQLGRYDGLVDFVEQRLELAGKITYRRLPSKDGEILSLLSEPVYESLDANNKAELLLDLEFDRVAELTLRNSDPSSAMLAFINNGHYQVYERFDGSEVRRFGRFADRNYPRIFEMYQSNFGESTPAIIFENGVMVQGVDDNIESSSLVTAVCDSCSQKSDFEKEMMEQSARFPVSVGRCGW